MRPLDGIRVVELGTMIAGPGAGCLLADLGADVIKVEPPDGEVARRMVGVKGPTSVLFENFNRGKRSVVLDLALDEARRSLRGLLEVSDVFISNFRPRFLERIGVGPHDLVAQHPSLIVTVISAFGLDDERRDVAGGDVIAQAASGIPYYTGEADRGPLLNLGAPADAVAASHACMAVLAALISRERTGRGALIDLAIVDSYMTTDPSILPAVLASDGAIAPERSGTTHPNVGPHGVYRGADGHIALSVFGSGARGHWGRLARAMGRADLADDPRLETDVQRIANSDEIRTAIEAWLADVGNDEESVRRLRAAGVVASRVLSPEEALSDERCTRRGVHALLDGQAGPLRVMGGPLAFGARVTGVASLEPAPRLGEHTAEVLREIARVSDGASAPSDPPRP